MKIALICGSPKAKNSASDLLLEDLKDHWGENAEITKYGFHKTAISEEVIEELAKSDAWVFAFPLYVDGIPGHLLSCLVQLEEARLQNPRIHIYGIVNCGFYEGIQAEFALKVLRNWCLKAGFAWGGGIGIGGAGALPMMPKMESGKGPKAPVDKAFAVLSDVILKQETQENTYVSIAFPRFLYQMAAQKGWRNMIKANGGKTKDLGKIPE
jgi:multimeric flavodoxin WrbA